MGDPCRVFRVCGCFVAVLSYKKCEEPPWSARNFIPYWSQLLSKEAQRGAAIEILNRVDGEAADREAARLRSAGS